MKSILVVDNIGAPQDIDYRYLGWFLTTDSAPPMSPWLFVILGAYIILSWLERITAFWLRRTKEFDRMFDIFTFVKKSRRGLLTP